MYEGQIIYSGPPKKVFKEMINRKLGVNIPTSVKIYESLINRGVHIPIVPLDPLELGKVVLEVKHYDNL